MSGELFTFADTREWPTPRIEARFTDLQQQEAAGYLTDSRKEQIHTEMANLAFEGLMRSREANQRETEVQELNAKMGSLAVHDTHLTLPGLPTKWKRQGK